MLYNILKELGKTKVFRRASSDASEELIGDGPAPGRSLFHVPFPNPPKISLTSNPPFSILDAIQFRHTSLQRQFTLLQSLQRLSPRNHLLPKLWSGRQRPNTHPPTLPTRHKTSQPVFPPPIASLAMLICRFDTQDGLYDCAWSEVHENQLVTASGDGSVKLFDITLKVGLFQWEEGLRG